MKLCIITSSFPVVEQDKSAAPFQIDFINYFVSKGVDVTVFTHSRPGKMLPKQGTYNLEFYASLNKDRRLTDFNKGSFVDLVSAAFLIMKGIRGLWKINRKEKFDVYLCCWAVPSGFYAAVLALITPKFPPFYIWALGSDINEVSKFRSGRILLRWILKKSKGLFADGFELARKVSNLSEKNCEFIASSRQQENFNTHLSTLENETVKLLFVGRHEKVKGVDCLIESLVLLSHKQILFECFIVGNGGLTDQLQKQIQDLGLQDKIKFTGVIGDDKLASLYRSVNCVVIPSRSESIPVVLNEAVSYGKAVIVTNVGDMGQLVNDYRLGIVVPTNDSKALCDALENYVKSPFTPSGDDIKKFMKFFSLEANAEKLLGFLRRG